MIVQGSRSSAHVEGSACLAIPAASRRSQTSAHGFTRHATPSRRRPILGLCRLAQDRTGEVASDRQVAGTFRSQRRAAGDGSQHHALQRTAMNTRRTFSIRQAKCPAYAMRGARHFQHWSPRHAHVRDTTSRRTATQGDVALDHRLVALMDDAARDTTEVRERPPVAVPEGGQVHSGGEHVNGSPECDSSSPVDYGPAPQG